MPPQKRFNLNASDRTKLQDLLDKRTDTPKKEVERQQTPRHHHGGIRIFNSSGEAIPPFGVMQCDEAELDREASIVAVVKPTASGNLFLFNGPREIAIDGYGFGYREGRAMFTASSVLPDLWSPEPDEWFLTNGGAHFRLVGSLDAETNYFLLVGAEYDRIEGLTTGAVAGGSTFTIDNIAVRRGVDPRTDKSSTSETVTVYNRFSEHANSSAICFAEWNASQQRWENYFLQSICPPSE